MIFSVDLEQAVLETLAYSDIFEYPLRLEEIYRYLPMSVSAEELPAALKALNGRVGEKDGFYFLVGREEIVSIRRQREGRSRELMPYALRYGRILGSLPFVRMVALTGSLAVLNVSKNPDFDYMLVTLPGRVWTARAFAVLFNRFTRPFGHTLCPNLIVAETALEWPLHDLYSARELCQMIPITGLDVYQKLLKANAWAKEFLPNAYTKNSEVFKTSEFWKLLAHPLRGKLGDRLEHWEMTRKIARFSKQDGFGEETIFTAEVCQGNFHHHRKWTKEVLEERLHVIASPVVAKQSPTMTEIASSPIGSSQ